MAPVFTARGGPSFMGTKRPAPAPRTLYLNDLDTDPQGVGLAYGGVFPGRLHAKGQLIETHEVQYSIGLSGSYLMYVSLRQPNNTQQTGFENVPGSPFRLEVAPGRAHHQTTQIPAASLPLRGSRTKDGGERKGFSCELSLPSFDKMGNRCMQGGAAVECGFVHALAERPTGTSAEDASSETPGAPNSTCTDMGNGTYQCKWFSAEPGEFDIFIKIDGLHIHGSPALLQLTQPAA